MTSVPRCIWVGLTLALLGCASPAGDAATPAPGDAAVDAAPGPEGGGALDIDAPTDGAGDGGAADSTACAPPDGPAGWQVLSLCRAQGELLSVWASGPSDAWAVGAGGQVLRYDGCGWDRLDAGTAADLWWVHGLPGGPTWIVGGQGTALRLRAGADQLEPTPTGVLVTLFGVWAAAEDDVWTVGFAPTGSAPSAILRWRGAAWEAAPAVPAAVAPDADIFKVWGSRADDVWVVGRSDLVLHWDGAGWTLAATGLGADWVTVAGRGAELILVGGAGQGVLAERTPTGWELRGPSGIPGLQGVCVDGQGTARATGIGATLLLRTADGWAEDPSAPFDLFSPLNPPVPGCGNPVPDYHACASDGAGGFFVVGGSFGALTEGALLHVGEPVADEGLTP